MIAVVIALIVVAVLLGVGVVELGKVARRQVVFAVHQGGVYFGSARVKGRSAAPIQDQTCPARQGGRRRERLSLSMISRSTNPVRRITGRVAIATASAAMSTVACTAGGNHGASKPT